MSLAKNDSRGFTLIAALIILVLLSGVAVGLMFMVTNETRMGGNDLETNLAYYGAESGMEKLTSDLATVYVSYLVPNTCQIQNILTTPGPPTSAMVGAMSYQEFITYPTNGPANNCTSVPLSSFNTIHAGSNQGLYAEIVPMTLQVIASRPAGATVNITRNVEVALIPVFQFGVFCGFDCSYFAGPPFSFGGRVHTNQNLFLASGNELVFNDKVQAFNQIVMDRLENGNLTTNGYGGTVYASSAAGGCPLNTFPPPTGAGTNCWNLPTAGTVPGDASWSGGYPSIGGATNPNFPSLSSGTFNYYLANSTTGVTNLQLPFVKNSCTSNPPPNCTDPISIVRKPLSGELATTVLGSERLYNKAQIRVLIADDPADLHPERGVAPIDASDVQLPNSPTFTGPGASPVFSNGAVTLAAGGTEYLGWGVVGSNGWVAPNIDAGSTGWAAGTQIPLFGELTTNPANPAAMTGPWIRVEWCSAATVCTGVTKEWLSLGFGRTYFGVPTAPGTNTVDPNAILILQELMPAVAQAAASGHGAGTQNNWYPINFYDAREGEMRDNNVNNVSFTPGAGKPGAGNTFAYSSCSVNGIMNAVELDVGNLNKWLAGTIGTTGTNVPYTAQNGYVLYFSDHRGMKKDPNPSNGGQTPANVYSGESGIEDVVNSGNGLASTATDGALEGTTYYLYSPEDVDGNGILDNWGEKNIGYGVGLNTNTVPLNPYLRVGVIAGADYTKYVDCASYNTTTGAWLTGANDQEGWANPVSGARHVLKLVDGGMSAAGKSYVPVIPAASGCVQTAANPTACGGFTVASENPVYVQGNYNSSSADAFWASANNPVPTQTPHSAASIIADSVTVLSNGWSDANSLMFPTNPGNRSTIADAYYRVAVSGGKNIPFPQPGWAAAAGLNDFGTDGGMHNFLRYLENWNNTLHYNGSLVNMYYAEYNTGVFKCCTTVYNPPTRNYYFDVLFLNPANLPPATPEFQDIVNLSYHQNFTPQ